MEADRFRALAQKPVSFLLRRHSLSGFANANEAASGWQLDDLAVAHLDVGEHVDRLLLLLGSPLQLELELLGLVGSLSLRGPGDQPVLPGAPTGPYSPVTRGGVRKLLCSPYGVRGGFRGLLS